MICSRCIGRFALAWALCFGTQDPGEAGTVSLPPSANTSITQKSSLKPDTLTVGTTGPSGGSASSRALLKFDIAGNIPSNAIITSVALTVTVLNVPATPTNSIFDLRAVLEAWSVSDATWTNRLAATPWSVPGGAIGVDFSGNISQTNFFGSTTGLYTFVSTSNLVADTQKWLQNSNSNFGWIVISEKQGTNFTERTLASSGNTANAPTLIIQYVTPPMITLLPPTNNIFRFSFNAESNRTYAVQYSGRLPEVNWNVLTNFSAAPVPTNWVVSDPFTSSNRFYHVQTP